MEIQIWKCSVMGRVGGGGGHVWMFLKDGLLRCGGCRQGLHNSSSAVTHNNKSPVKTQDLGIFLLSSATRSHV